LLDVETSGGCTASLISIARGAHDSPLQRNMFM
jgi:hypothetical protein